MNTPSILLTTDQLGMLIEPLLPACSGLYLYQFAVASDELTLLMASSRSEACCPLCRQPTGQVEGQITRLKYLKRQMYGRAGIDLLRLRVLHAA